MNLEQEFAVAQRRTQSVIDRGVASALRRIGPTAADRREQMERISEWVNRVSAGIAAMGDAVGAAIASLAGMAVAIRYYEGTTDE